MKNNKKYIIITPFFPSKGNHIGSFVYDQARALVSIGDYDVHVIKVVAIFSKEKSYSFNNIYVRIFKVIDFPFFIFPGVFNYLNSVRVLNFFRSNDLLSNIDVIHSHVCYPSAYLANAVSSVKNVKTIVQHHGIDVLQLSNCRFSLFRIIQKRFLISQSLKELNNIGMNVSVSNRVRMALHWYKYYDPKDEYILYNGVDRKKFFNKKIKTNSKTYTIGCVANFWKIKDHINLIKAVNMLVVDGVTDIRLRLIGTGERLSYCKQYVTNNNLDLHVTFEEEISHCKLNDFYNELDLFVLPSYYEALGCVLMEAWATDTVIISIKGQGITEIIPSEEEQNLLANPSSPRSLRKRILSEYNKKREFPFDDRYNIDNTIKEFLAYPFFKSL